MARIRYAGKMEDTLGARMQTAMGIQTRTEAAMGNQP